MVDLAAVLEKLAPALNAASVAEIDAPESELYGYCQEAAIRLAERFGMFAERDTTLETTAEQPTVSLSIRHVAMVYGWVDVDGVWRPVHPISVAELEALSDSPNDDYDDPSWATEDLEAPFTLRLYPVPYREQSLQICAMVRRPALHPGLTTIAAPSVLAAYFRFFVLARVRGKESDAGMPDVANYAQRRLNLLEAAIGRYWGGL